MIESSVNKFLQTLFDCVKENDCFVGYSDVPRRKGIIMYMQKVFNKEKHIIFYSLKGTQLLL